MPSPNRLNGTTSVQASDLETSEKLIAAAERLFAEHGYNGVSVRMIAAAAGVNWSLLGYYFRGKEGLLSEVYRRHCGELNSARMRLLQEIRAGGRKPELEEILSIDDYRIVSFDENSLGLIMNAMCVLRVRIDYVDEKEIRDRDEDALPTELRTYSSVRCALKIFVSVNLATQKFNETELLTREVIVE